MSESNKQPGLKLTKYMWEITVINKRNNEMCTHHATSVGVSNLITRAKYHFKTKWKCDIKEIEIIKINRGYLIDF